MAHTPAFLRDGLRWEPQGEVCDECSDPENGIWVPVSFCEEAMTTEEYGGTYFTTEGKRKTEEFYRDL